MHKPYLQLTHTHVWHCAQLLNILHTAVEEVRVHTHDPTYHIRVYTPFNIV